MKRLGSILIAAALCGPGIAFSQTPANPFDESAAAPAAKAASTAKADQNGEEQEPPLVVEVYEVGDLSMVGLPSYPAKKLNDLGDGQSLFPEKDELSATSFYSMNYGPYSNSSPNGCMIPDRNDALVSVLTKVISPTAWDEVGGSSSIKSFGDLLVISTTEKNHDAIRSLLGQIRKHIASRKTLVVETHWLWLSEEQLNRLAPNSSGTVDEKAWDEHQKQLNREDSDLITGYHATIACMNGQTVSAVAGTQRRFIISLIPVVGDNGTAAPQVISTPSAESRAVGYQPQSATVQEGAALQVRPILCGEDQVVVDLHGRVVEVEIPYAPEDSPAKEAAKKTNGGSENVVAAIAKAVDRPVVNTARIDTTFRAPLGSRTLVGGVTGSTRPEPGEPNLYLFAKVTVREAAKETQNNK